MKEANGKDKSAHLFRALVRGAYDIQGLRIEMGNRIVANFREKVGLNTDNGDVGKKLLDVILAEYRTLTDGIVKIGQIKGFPGDGVISDHAELFLIQQYLVQREAEKAHFGYIEKALKKFPIYTLFLQGVKGVGPAMAGVIISEIDITKARYPSSLWKYAGLDVAEDGRGRSRRKEHLIDVEYKNKKGEMKTRKGITFNPFLKSKLLGVLAGSFLKAGENKYEQIYRDYKHRLESHGIYKDVIKGHRHAMAGRYAVKMFLVDLYAEWRAIEGLPVSKPYCEEKLGVRQRSKETHCLQARQTR